MPILIDAYQNPEPAHSFSSTFWCELPTQPHPQQHTHTHTHANKLAHITHTSSHAQLACTHRRGTPAHTLSHTKEPPHTQNKGHTHTHTHTLWFTHLLTHPPKFMHTRSQSDEQAVVHTGPPTRQHRDAYTLVHTHQHWPRHRHTTENSTHLGRRQCSPSRGGTTSGGQTCQVADRARSRGPSRGRPRSSTRPW